MAPSYPELPIDAEDRGSYIVWDLRAWNGDIETMKRINERWVEAHEPAEKEGTISIFPEDVVVHGEIQEFISEGWNEACEATDLQYLAIVAEGLQAMAVENQIDAPAVELSAFDDEGAAVDWMDERAT